LIRQLLTESTLLSLASGTMGLLFAAGGLKTLLLFVPSELAVLREARLNGWVLDSRSSYAWRQDSHAAFSRRSECYGVTWREC